jgi:hypothetical protein
MRLHHQSPAPGRTTAKADAVSHRNPSTHSHQRLTAATPKPSEKVSAEAEIHHKSTVPPNFSASGPSPSIKAKTLNAVLSAKLFPAPPDKAAPLDQNRGKGPSTTTKTNSTTSQASTPVQSNAKEDGNDSEFLIVCFKLTRVYNSKSII